MSLPDAWIERLIARLQLRYGAQWTQAYAGIDPAAVKADWSQVLTGLTLDNLDLGVRRLPADRPPNAMQFRALCFTAAPPAVERALPAPKADAGRIRNAISRAHEPSKLRAAMSSAGYCVYRILSSEAARKRGRLGLVQADMVRSCCERLTEADRDELARAGYALAEFEQEAA